MQRFERFLDRRVVVPTVDLVEIDVIHAEAAQARVDLGEDRFARQPGAVRAGAHPAINLGGDDDLVAAGKLLDCAAEDFLAVAERVAVRGIEEVDAGFERALDERSALLFAERPCVVAPVTAPITHAAEADARDLEAGAAELCVLHD